MQHEQEILYRARISGDSILKDLASKAKENKVLKKPTRKFLNKIKDRLQTILNDKEKKKYEI